MTLFVILKWKFENFWNLYHIWCFSLVWYRFVLPRAGTSFHMYHIRNFLLIWYIFLLLWAGQALYLYHIWNFSRIWYRFLLVSIGEQTQSYGVILRQISQNKLYNLSQKNCCINLSLTQQFYLFRNSLCNYILSFIICNFPIYFPVSFFQSVLLFLLQLHHLM